MIQTTTSVAVQPDLRRQYRKIIQPSGRNFEPSFAIPDTDQEWSLGGWEKGSEGMKRKKRTTSVSLKGPSAPNKKEEK